MKEDWKIRTLGDISVQMADGPFGSNLKKEHYTEKREVRIIQLSNIGEDGWREENTKYTTFTHLESIKRSEVFPNDIVIAKMMPAGRAIICPSHENKFVLSSDAVKVQIKKGLNLRFILYSINSSYFRKQVYDNVSGSGRVRTSLTKLRDCKLLIPPIEEQQRIVGILDAEFKRIDALKANAEKNLQNAKALFQAALKKELEPKEGWIKTNLNNIYDVRDGTHDSPKYHQTGYPLVTSKNLRNGSVDLDDVKLISQEDYDKINERSKVDVGDVLFAMIGTIGNPCYVEEEPRYAIKNMALFKVPAKQSGLLLKYILSSDMVLSEMHNKAKGSNQPFVSLGYLRGFEISLPPSLEEQEQLVTTIMGFEKKCKTLQDNYTQTIALCDDLKQALLRKAFNGDL